MTDFVIDIKTRLLQQAAELGISNKTAALLAACIDETAKDYTGERVYIGKPATALIEMSARNRSIVRDWRAGERIPLLMRRYGMSRTRIYEIIRECAPSS